MIGNRPIAMIGSAMAAVASTLGAASADAADATRVVEVATTPSPLSFFDDYSPVSNLFQAFKLRSKAPKRRPPAPKRPHAAIVHTAQRRARRVTRLHAK